MGVRTPLLMEHYMNYNKRFINSDTKTFVEVGLVDGRPRFTMGVYEVKEGKALDIATAFISLSDSDRLDMSDYLEYCTVEGVDDGITLTHIQDKGIIIKFTLHIAEDFMEMELKQNGKIVKTYRIVLSDIDLRSSYYRSTWAEANNIDTRLKVVRMLHDFIVTNYGTYLSSHQIYEYLKAHNGEQQPKPFVKQQIKEEQ